jgi:hypothetical protein
MKLYDIDGREVVVKETKVHNGSLAWGVFKVVKEDPESGGRYCAKVGSIPPQTDRERAEILARGYIERRGGRMEVAEHVG